MQRVWTDGACKGNPGPGGWAWATPEGQWASGAAAHTTNQRMEVEAAYEAVKSIDGPVTVVSDSTYVVNCFRDRWWEGWLKRGWKNSQKKPVANQDLWAPFIDLYRTRDDVFFEWVKGHSGDVMNDLVDRIAVEAAERQVGGCGTEHPTELGPADDVSGSSTAGSSTAGPSSGDAASGAKAASPVAPSQSTASARDKRLPAGRLLGVFGHRPPEIGGYDDNPTARSLRRKLREIMEAKAALDPDLRVVSGLRLGAEQLGAEAAIDAGLPVVAVLPFPDAEAKWPAESRKRFASLVDASEATIMLERKVPDSSAKIAGSLRRRDAWLARNLDEAVVVWDGTEEFVGRLTRSLQDRLGDDVWELTPPW